MADTGTTTFRPPYTPVAFAALAGRDRGRMFDPERVTALHDWHVRAGAVFEDVGQWKRPRYYPQPGEDMDAAVLRECAATRTGVGILDGSTLGKIDVQGPDAATFLDLIYTNLMSSLKVGAVRYGVMCGVDGMVIDDGTVLRLADEQFLVLTTTGGAAESWTGWRSGCRPSGHTCGCSAPRSPNSGSPSRWSGPDPVTCIGAVFGERRRRQRSIPVHGDPGHHPGRRPGAAGPDQLLRRTGLRGVCQPLVRGRRCGSGCSTAGAPYGITPYGTETMHVLRAEKGYPIIGQDTDGTVSPHDLGLAWAVSKKKVDFIGKRSFARAANRDPLRKQLVGLLPVDRQHGAAGGLADHRVRRGRPTAAAAGADARPRDIQLPQRRTRPPVRARPGQGRPVAGRRHRARPRSRHPGPGRGHRVGAGRSRRSPSRWLS